MSIVHAPPLYIQEKVHPTVLIDDFKMQIEELEKKDAEIEQVDLFSDFYGRRRLRGKQRISQQKTEGYNEDQV